MTAAGGEGGPAPGARPPRRLDPRRWSTGTRIAVTLVVAALVPMVVVGWASLRTGGDAVERSQLASVQATAQFSAATLGEFLTGVVAQADQLATQPEVVAAMAAGPAPAGTRLDPAVLASVLGASPDFASVLLIDRTGAPVDALPALAVTSGPYGERPWFQAALAGSPSVSDVVAGTQPSSLSTFVAVPARPPGSAAVGVVAIEVRAEAVLWAVNRAPQSPGSQVLLVNRDTVVVGARDHRLRYRALTEAGAARATAVAGERGYPVEVVEPLSLSGFGPTMVDGVGTVTNTSLAGSGDQIVAYDQVEGRDLWVVVAEPRSTFLAPIDRLADQVVVAGILVGLVAALGAILLARRMSRPITALTQAASAVERGDPAHAERLDRWAHGHSDLADLARVMARMVREVAERERRLREQVQALKVEIDHERRAKEVAEVVESDFFKDLESRAADMRRRARGGTGGTGGTGGGAAGPGGPAGPGREGAS